MVCVYVFFVFFSFHFCRVKQLRHYFPTTQKIKNKYEIFNVNDYCCQIRKNSFFSSDTIATPRYGNLDDAFVIRKIPKTLDLYDLIENDMRMWKRIDNYNANNKNNPRKYRMNRYCIDSNTYNDATNNQSYFEQGDQTGCMKIFGIYESRTHIFYKLPFIERSLFYFLMQNKITDFESFHILRQCCIVLGDMHKLGLAHRRVSLQSFLIDTNLNVLLDNYTLTCRYNDNNNNNDNNDNINTNGDSEFLAPEVLTNANLRNASYDWRRNDVFGIGVIALLMLFRSSHKSIHFKSSQQQNICNEHADKCFEIGFYEMVEMYIRLECGEVDATNLDDANKKSMQLLDVMLDKLGYYDNHYVEIVKLALHHNPNQRITLNGFQQRLEGLMNKLICNHSNPHSISLSHAYFLGGNDAQTLPNCEKIKRWCTGVRIMVQTMNETYNMQIDDESKDNINDLMTRYKKYFSNERSRIIKCAIVSNTDNSKERRALNVAFRNVKSSVCIVAKLFVIKHFRNTKISQSFENKWNKFLQSELCHADKFQTFDDFDMRQEFDGHDVDDDCDNIALLKNTYLQQLNRGYIVYPHAFTQNNA